MGEWLRHQKWQSRIAAFTVVCLTDTFIPISGKMKTSLLGNCVQGNLYLPKSLAGVFLSFRMLAILLVSIYW